MILLLSVLFVLSGCNSSNPPLLDDKINPDNVDAIQVVMSMGSPDFGADSKIITDRDEIYNMVEIFNHATIGAQAHDVPPAMSSFYLFFSGDTLMHHFSFSFNDARLISLNSRWYNIYYLDQTPFQLYLLSTAPTIVVDLYLNEMERPE